MSGPASTPPAERPLPLVLLQQLRPRQWTKNAAVLAPLVFARSLFESGSALRAVLAAAGFSLAASGIYVLNDWLDREKDRLHPEKRHRPIAAGRVGPGLAGLLLAGCWAVAAALCLQLGSGFAWVLGGYVALQVLYSFWLKHQVVVDVLVIAVGFVLRVVGGAVAISVPVSNWLYLCTLLLALFLGFAKRRAELGALAGDAEAHRANLGEYSVPLLDQLISVTAACCILAYGLYTVSPDTVRRVGSDDLKFTVPFVVHGIFRYLYLVHRRGLGGSPEKVLLSDAPMVVTVLGFVSAAGLVLYRHG
ncbi:MAG: decaprenyl-phosphate phosphoribosyltransferase [Deltaproteobacteria bacterium]|nr:decaprenyl-phosphate phosphoribosyltransferase [Deltaproteobacteria bacterium]